MSVIQATSYQYCLLHVFCRSFWNYWPLHVWLLKCFTTRKESLHFLQQYSRSLISCLSWCVCKCSFTLNFFSHISHSNRLSLLSLFITLVFIDSLESSLFPSITCSILSASTNLLLKLNANFNLSKHGLQIWFGKTDVSYRLLSITINFYHRFIIISHFYLNKIKFFLNKKSFLLTSISTMEFNMFKISSAFLLFCSNEIIKARASPQTRQILAIMPY